MVGEGAGMVICLHGDLELEIIEAQCLPNMDLVSERLRCFLTVFDCRRPFMTHKRRDRYYHRNIITSDPYVTVCLGGAVVARTRVLANSQDPVWNEHFKIPSSSRFSGLEYNQKFLQHILWEAGR
ncbi:hypothetical protein SASPL_131110 [Salvia splendens]|uniref:C2 domain-containing protein n=1 Tax=Salvia splendens TaxID=180675 RepID=A0A8X8ZK12_SALSN|nr:hypothetical protein SASPL_131110 [Salvia splendens]